MLERSVIQEFIMGEKQKNSGFTHISSFSKISGFLRPTNALIHFLNTPIVSENSL